MRSVGKGLVTKHYSVCIVICTALVTGGVVSAAGEKDAAYYYRVGDWAKAIGLYRAALVENSPKGDFAMAAEACYRIGSLDQAENFANRALGSADNVEARVLLSLIRAKKGRSDEAVQELEAMLRKDPDDYRVLTALGIITSSANTETALSYLSKAADINPDYFPAWFQTGLIYEEEESFAQATKAYRRAVEANPLSAQGHNNLGYSYKERHFYEYAVGEYLKAIELMPDNAGYYYNIGNAYTHQEKIDDAFQAYEKALELDPTFAKAHYNLARTYLRMDMVREAIGEFNLYLKYGNGAVFGFVAPKGSVESEIEQLEYYLKYNPPQRPPSGDITR